MSYHLLNDTDIHEQHVILPDPFSPPITLPPPQAWHTHATTTQATQHKHTHQHVHGIPTWSPQSDNNTSYEAEPCSCASIHECEHNHGNSHSHHILPMVHPLIQLAFTQQQQQQQQQQQNKIEPSQQPSTISHDFSDMPTMIEAEPCTCDPPNVGCDHSIPGRPIKKMKKEPTSTSTSPKQELKVFSKTGKPILPASAKRQLRRQKQRAKAEPKYIELADGQKANLGQRRSKYAALLEKLNQDLARVQQELVEQKSLNKTLLDNNQNLQQQLNVAQSTCHPRLDELQAQLVQLTTTKSQLMQAHASDHVYDFFKMSSPVMILLQDFNLRIIDANSAFLSEHGWTRSEIIGRRLPLMHMAIFFIPGYDSNLIPVDDNDIPPLHAGLPRGVGPDQMHGNPANYPIYHNLFRGKIDTATVREISLDGKGRLFKTTITNWLAYYKEETPSDPNTPSTASQPILSRPQTRADDAYRALIGIQFRQPPFHPEKGHPKYYVSMESAYDREYIRPTANTRLWDAPPIRGPRTIDDGELSRKMSWSGPHPLKDVAKLAEQVATWRQPGGRTGHPNIVGLGAPSETSCSPSTTTTTTSAPAAISAPVTTTTPMTLPKPTVSSTGSTPQMTPTNSPIKRKYAATFTPTTSTTTTTTTTTTSTTPSFAFPLSTSLGSLPTHLQQAAAVALAANKAQQQVQAAQSQGTPYSPIPLNIPPHAALPPNPDHVPLPKHVMPIAASPFDNAFTPTNIPFSSDLHAPAAAAPW